MTERTVAGGVTVQWITDKRSGNNESAKSR